MTNELRTLFDRIVDDLVNIVLERVANCPTEYDKTIVWVHGKSYAQITQAVAKLRALGHNTEANVSYTSILVYKPGTT